jgi:AP2-associated kinase
MAIMKDLVQGVKHMHSLGITHRDLKIENVLYHNSKFKLCDFGSASTEFIDYQFASKI